jgi:tetratricopeptide (TPR) repeat protein
LSRFGQHFTILEIAIEGIVRSKLRNLCLAILIVAETSAFLKGQEASVPEVLASGVRSRVPVEENRRQALVLYGVGLLCLRNNRLLEATSKLEEAWKLDPAAAPISRSLVPLYLALGRTEEALTLSRRTLDLAPDDFETWHSYARQLHGLGKKAEAIEAMARAADCPSLREQPHELAQITYDLGILYQDSSNLSKALISLQRAETALQEHAQSLLNFGQVTDQQLHVELARTCERIAQICVKLQKYDEAVKAYARAQTIIRDDLHDPFRSRRLDLDLAKAYQSAGHLEKSLELLDQYLKTQPSEAEPYQLRIGLLKDLGRESETIPSLKKFVEQDSHNMELRLLLAEQYSKSAGNWNQAQAEYEEIIRENPVPEAYRGLFEILKKKGHVEEILSSLDRSIAAANPKSQGKTSGEVSAAAKARAMLEVIRNDPELIRELIPLGVARSGREQELQWDTRRFLAVLAARTKQLEAAEAFYRDCLRESSGAPIFQRHEQEIYIGLLEVLQLQNKNEELVRTCREGLKQTQLTNRLLFHDYLARSLSAMGKTEEALAEVDQAVQLADEKSLIHYRLLRARILAAADQNEKAVNECLALLKDASEAEDVHQVRYTLSWVYTAAHENGKAEEQLRRILQDHPDDATAHNDLGYLMADQGRNLPEAEDLVRKAISIDRRKKTQEAHVGPDDDQDNAAYVDSLGWVLFRRGQLREALEELQRAATLQDGDDPVIWDHLGDVYLRLDNFAKARESWSKAVSLYEKEKRRKLDDQYKELKHKLKFFDSR